MAAAGAIPRMCMGTTEDWLFLRPMTLSEQRQWTATQPPVQREYEQWHRDLLRNFFTVTIDGAETIIDGYHERERLRAALYYQNVRYEYEPLRVFVTELVMNQDLSNVTDRHVLLGKCMAGDDESGLQLLEAAVEELTRATITYNGQTLDALYRDLLAAGRLNPAMPRTATELLTYKLGNTDTRIALLDEYCHGLEERDAA